MVPLVDGSLTYEQKRKSLRPLIFLKYKHCGSTKGRACADDSCQRNKIKNEDTIPPIIALESLILTAGIGSQEERDVVV